jgi:hypothetical protein
MNSLCHKGSNHIANSTAPDVCKTPSPAGPVPIPYPIIVSMSSDLVKGTTTVKADGGNSISVKDSEWSRCTGDEPGTAGGVVSNVNMKEAKFILFSFDVKFDGKNACRLSDKLTMNHMNTVCMGGALGKPVTTEEYDLNIDCDDKKKNHDWDECMVAQLCQMVNDLNANKDKLKKISPSPRSTPKYAQHLSSFKSAFKAAVDKPESEEKLMSFFNPADDNCAYKKWKKGGGSSKPSGRGTGKFNPDHTIPASLGGPLEGISALKWVEARVNMTAGPAMNNFDPDKHDKMTASKCCT